MNKKLKRLYIKLVILILCFFVFVRIVTLVLSKYESEAKSTANVDVAFYLINEDYKTMTLNLESIFPQNDAYIYNFSVGNIEKNKTAEIDIIYNLTIRTTTNLPLTFELYEMIGTGKKNIIKTNTIEQDEYGTYFRKITTDSEELYYKQPKTNLYQLIVSFPENYNTTNYQNILDVLEINVDSQQMTS
ncbi:MAG: hypothetical protein BHV99_05550 [Clostridium sp. 26_21]|nr:MAG: hypothetical protein BHV99_05550 [Clostridium sp. 26_21]